MGEEDEDYMSDVFLQQSTDVRPGLLSKTQKRKRRLEDQQVPKKKKLTMVEAQKREQGLATPISQDNKGFSLLEKMGYRKGSGIGKEGKEETTLIPLVLKDGRSGLGRSTFLLEQEKDKVVKKQEDEEQVLTHFLHRKQQNQTLLKMEGDLRRSQTACEQLDRESGFTAPDISWYWVSEKDQTLEDEESDDSDCGEEPTLAEKLTALTDYLRENYFYCVWCGISYENDGDISQHCPGNTREVHDDT